MDGDSMDRERLAALYGVDVTYRPAPGTEIAVPTDTVVAVLAALGVDATTHRAVKDALAAYEQRAAHRLLPPCTVLRAGRRTLEQALPRLPAGTRLAVTTESGEPLPETPATPGRYTLRATAE